MTWLWRASLALVLASCTPDVGYPINPNVPTEARLVMPNLISLPYVSANAGGSELSVTVENQGEKTLTGPDGGDLVWTLSGDPLLSIVSAPTSIEGETTATLTLSFAGASQETIAEALLTATTATGDTLATVFGVAGDASLGVANWERLEGPNEEFLGDGVTLSLPTAPYPDAGSTFTDASVRIFVPEGYRERGSQDVILHFHGHNTTLAATLAGHRYQQHVYASGVNAILVVPQGPVNAASGDFGKLMSPANTEAFLRQVLVVLYREGMIFAPKLNEVVLTSHSGGYQAVAANINNGGRFLVSQVNLFDSLYGFSSTYEDFALAGGLLRSNYTTGGGTLANNQALVSSLQGAGLAVSEDATTLSLLQSPADIYFADTSHNGTTRLEAAYAEQLRWGMLHSRHGPRIEVRQATVTAGIATISWLSPRDEDLEKFVVETSTDGVTWTEVAEASSEETSVSFPVAGLVRARVVPVLLGVLQSESLPSNEVVLSEGNLLIVDGFDRRIDGSFAGLSHPFAAKIGEAAGASGYLSHRALTEDGFSLQGVETVIWLLGDESISDLSLSDEEQAILNSYLQSGGRLLISGSELAFDLDNQGSAFLTSTLGASLAADDSNSFTVSGVGPLSALSGFSFSGAEAPYQEDFPDALTAQNGAEVLLRYANGMNAAVGRNNRVILVGFPLELIDPASRGAVLQGLLGYLQ